MPLTALRISSFNSYASNLVSRRFNPITGIYGLYCMKPIPAETLIACVPVFACISPNIVRATKAGQTLDSWLRPEGYTAIVGAGRMEVSRDSMLVASFTALSANRGPLKTYLMKIHAERNSEVLREKLRFLGGEALLSKYIDLQQASAAVLTAAYTDIRNGVASREHAKAPSPSFDFTLDQFILANALCESRVLSIPTDLDGKGFDDNTDERQKEEEDDVFGGPALIPWFDLINHSDKPSNISAAVMRTSLLPEQLQRIAPLCVVGATRRDLRAGEEITYEYAEPIPNARNVLTPSEYENRLLLWATRFHFIPPHLE